MVNFSLFSFFSLSLSLFEFFVIFAQRMDLGECPKVHDLALRADYEKAAKHKDYYYDIDVSSTLFSFDFKRQMMECLQLI